MDVEMANATPCTPVPAVRSTVAIPRTSTPPSVASRPASSLAAAPPSAPPRSGVRRTTAPSAAAGAPAASGAPRTQPSPPSLVQHEVEQEPLRCGLCHRRHALSACLIFRDLQPAQRQQVARAHGHCLNCLALSHTTWDCTSTSVCRVCHRPHHTMLHRFPARPERASIVRRHQQRGPRQRAPTLPRRFSERDHERRSRPAPANRHRPPSSNRSRPPSRSHHRRPTGLGNVVETLQQLQRLLG